MSYDCLAILGMTLEQAAFSFGWGELINFSNHLPPDSAISRALRPEAYSFSSDLQHSELLASLFDAVQLFAWMFSKKGKRPKPYPRPWDASDDQKFGSDPIPISEFNKWYYGGE